MNTMNRTTWICALLATTIACSEENPMVPPELSESLPPEMSDTTLVARASNDVDAVCTDGKLGVLEVNIGRVVDNVEALLHNKTISKTATVQVWLKDPGAALSIEFNGHVVPGEVSERDGEWSLAYFAVPIEHVNFAKNPGQLGRPIPARNTIAIRSSDKSGSGLSCSAYGGAAVVVYPVPLPVVLFHKLHPFGNETDFDNVWVDPDPDDDTTSGGLDDHGVNYRDPALVYSNPAWVMAANDVATEVAEAKLQFNASRVTLIGHSMGGMASRAYAENASDVANVLTIASPHAGSRLFNVLVRSIIGRKKKFLYPFYEADPAPSMKTLLNMTTRFMRIYNWRHGPNPTVNYETIGSVYNYAIRACIRLCPRGTRTTRCARCSSTGTGSSARAT